MKISLLLFLFCLSQAAQATHLLGGFIQAQKTGTLDKQYTINVILFMDEVNGSIAAQQTAMLLVCFGDGSSDAAQRIDRSFLPGNASVSRNVYAINHTYAGPGTYTALCLIANRTDGLANIPALLGTPLGLSTTFSTNILNSTPVLPFIKSDTAYTFQKLALSIQATDAEGDSLVYRLANPLTATTATCVPQLLAVPSFVFPNNVSQRGIFRIDGQSGLLTWNAPTAIGRYDFAITVQEYRKGVLLSQTQYEQVILVIDKANSPPGTIPPYEPAQPAGDGIITGIGDPENVPSPAVTVFPVPAYEQLQVTIFQQRPGAIIFRLIDMAGRIVHESQQITSIQRYSRTIDIRSLSSGVYLLQAQVDGKTVTKKVLVQ